MADQKISELTALTGANVADDDAIAIVDTSATETKKIVFSELKNALDTATGFVRITGDTMTGALDVQSTITADGLTVANPGVVAGDFDGGAAATYIRLQDDTDNFIFGTNNSLNSFLIKNETSDAVRLTIANNGDISFYEDTGTTPKFFWDASAESLGIGTTTPSAYGAGYTTVGVNGSTMSGVEGFVGGTLTSYTQTYAAQTLMGTKTSTPLVFTTNDTQRMRIDSSGEVYIGHTGVTAPWAMSGSQYGINLMGSGGFIGAARANAEPLLLNRTGSDGAILNFRKDGTTVGSISTAGGTIRIDSGTAYSGLGFDQYVIYPRNSGANSDNLIDLGYSNYRFDDIYATNGTIQTSDANEKQDIAELTDAEQRVAVAAKGLLRKFRWKNAVTEKGDEARTHFGIIAQDLQAAFAAEGLDAGDYAMFISSTWTDEETGEEKTRMGVRYSELLAFIIAAI